MREDEYLKTATHVVLSGCLIVTLITSGCVIIEHVAETTPEVVVNRSTDIGRSRESIIEQSGYPDIAINDDGVSHYYYENYTHELGMILPLPLLLSTDKLTEPYCSILSFGNNDVLSSIDYRKGSCSQAVYIRQSPMLIQEHAETGDAEAQWELYKRYNKVDSINNMKWLCRAADQGHYWARMELGRLYQDGKILKQDMSQAYLWYALAAQTGQFLAADKIVELRKIMSHSQIDNAKRYITNWRPGDCENSINRDQVNDRF